MAENTSIEWCDATFNPWQGCAKISPGCDNCYAEASVDKRLHVVQWGPGKPRKRTSATNWAKPLKWNAVPFYACSECDWRGETDGNCPRCAAEVTSARRRVFCASLADVFDNEVNPTWRTDLFALIRGSPNLDWLLLTKRIGNVPRQVMEANMELARTDAALAWGPSWESLPRNVWLGITIVNQEEADRDIHKLLTINASRRFLSMEPLLGPVDVSEWLSVSYPSCSGFAQGKRMEAGYCGACAGHASDAIHVSPERALEWVIVGGESGHGARLGHPAWYRGLRDQCAAAGVPFLFKQHGEWAWVRDIPEIHEAKRGLWVRQDGTSHDGTADSQFSPGGTDALMWHVGKKLSGRLLDGVEHNACPGDGRA